MLPPTGLQGPVPQGSTRSPLGPRGSPAPPAYGPFAAGRPCFIDVDDDGDDDGGGGDDDGDGDGDGDGDVGDGGDGGDGGDVGDGGGW